MEKISIIFTNFNTLKYSKWCYESIRKNLNPHHEIVMIDDCSTDGTWEWIQGLPNINIIKHQNDKNMGIAYSYNKGVDLATNEIVYVIHSDMYFPPKHDEIMLEELKKYDFLTSWRVEPPIYPGSPDKVQMDFGKNLEEWKEDEYLNFELPKSNGLLRTCFPWMTTKKVFNRVNGIDELFLKYMVDDDDFYLRIAKAGYKYWQTHKTACYHMCSRTTKYKDDNISTEGSSEWNNQYTRSTRNFIRKWGSGQNHSYTKDMSMNTKIKKYDIGIVVHNCDPNILYHLEPWCSNIYVDMIRDPYIMKTMENTMYDVQERVRDINDEWKNDIIIELDGTKLSNENFKYITQLSFIIPDSGGVGKFELGIFNITINKLEPMDEEQLISDGFRNTEGYKN